MARTARKQSPPPPTTEEVSQFIRGRFATKLTKDGLVYLVSRGLLDMPPEVLTNYLTPFLGLESVVELAQSCKALRSLFGAWLVQESLVHLPNKSLSLVPQTLHWKLYEELWCAQLGGTGFAESNHDVVLSTIIALIRLYYFVIQNRLRAIPWGQGKFDWKAAVTHLKLTVSSSLLSKQQEMKLSLMSLGKKLLDNVEQMKTLPSDKWVFVGRIPNNIEFEAQNLTDFQQLLEFHPIGAIENDFRGGMALIPFDLAIFLRWFVHDYQRLSDALEPSGSLFHHRDHLRRWGHLTPPSFDGTIPSMFAQIFDALPAGIHQMTGGEKINDKILWMFSRLPAKPLFNSDEEYALRDEYVWTCLDAHESPNLLLLLFPHFGESSTRDSETNDEYNKHYVSATKMFIDCSFGTQTGTSYGNVLTANAAGVGLPTGKDGLPFCKTVSRWWDPKFFSMCGLDLE
ncbi:hypothetical protein HK100_007999 [Physocladia obscura]|uniref:F-box domain-containing protein n=1 Tax=Physocladia obscura TaxID=109957 RepID=A0AAD5XII8_9FUNG|nr:hypothetical protein HK100_007999 [Physocladia obscura]